MFVMITLRNIFSLPFLKIFKDKSFDDDYDVASPYCCNIQQSNALSSFFLVVQDESLKTAAQRDFAYSNYKSLSFSRSYFKTVTLPISKL